MNDQLRGRDRPRLLVVDFEEGDSEFVERARQADFDVYQASGAAAALAEALRVRPDVVVADRCARECSDVDLLDRLRTQLSSTIRVLITAPADRDTVVRALHGGEIAHFAEKPFCAAALANVLEWLVRARTVQEERDDLRQRLSMRDAAPDRVKRERDASGDKHGVQSVRDATMLLFNRDYFLEFLRLELDRSKRYYYPLSLLRIGIDQVSELRESPAAAETFMARVAEIFQPEAGGLRASDVVGCIEADEVGIILPETSGKHAAIKAERIRDEINRVDWRALLPEPFTELTVSVGAATYNVDAGTAEGLMEVAATMRDEAARLGGDRVAAQKHSPMFKKDLGYWRKQLGLWNFLTLLPGVVWAFVIQRFLWRYSSRHCRGTTGQAYYDEQKEQFDARYGTDTMKCMQRGSMGGDAEVRDQAAGYGPAPLAVVRAILERLPSQHSDFVFVDAGCGKGRVLLLAGHYRFKRVIGVEFSPPLVRIARDNVRKYRQHEDLQTEIEVVCADASRYRLARENTVVYMFAPFGFEIIDGLMTEVLDVVEAGKKVVVVWVGAPPFFFRKYNSWLKRSAVFEPKGAGLGGRYKAYMYESRP